MYGRSNMFDRGLTTTTNNTNNQYGNSSFRPGTSNGGNYGGSNGQQQLGSYRTEYKYQQPTSYLQQIVPVWKQNFPSSITTKQQILHMSSTELRIQDYYLMRTKQLRSSHDDKLRDAIKNGSFNEELLKCQSHKLPPISQEKPYDIDALRSGRVGTGYTSNGYGGSGNNTGSGNSTGYGNNSNGYTSGNNGYNGGSYGSSNNNSNNSYNTRGNNSGGNSGTTNNIFGNSSSTSNNQFMRNTGSGGNGGSGGNMFTGNNSSSGNTSVGNIFGTGNSNSGNNSGGNNSNTNGGNIFGQNNNSSSANIFGGNNSNNSIGNSQNKVGSNIFANNGNNNSGSNSINSTNRNGNNGGASNNIFNNNTNNGNNSNNNGSSGNNGNNGRNGSSLFGNGTQGNNIFSGGNSTNNGSNNTNRNNPFGNGNNSGNNNLFGNSNNSNNQSGNLFNGGSNNAFMQNLVGLIQENRQIIQLLVNGKNNENSQSNVSCQSRNGFDMFDYRDDHHHFDCFKRRSDSPEQVVFFAKEQKIQINQYQQPKNHKKLNKFTNNNITISEQNRISNNYFKMTTTNNPKINQSSKFHNQNDKSIYGSMINSRYITQRVRTINQSKILTNRDARTQLYQGKCDFKLNLEVYWINDRDKTQYKDDRIIDYCIQIDNFNSRDEKAKDRIVAQLKHQYGRECAWIRTDAKITVQKSVSCGNGGKIQGYLTQKIININPDGEQHYRIFYTNIRNKCIESLTLSNENGTVCWEKPIPIDDIDFMGNEQFSIENNAIVCEMAALNSKCLVNFNGLMEKLKKIYEKDPKQAKKQLGQLVHNKSEGRFKLSQIWLVNGEYSWSMSVSKFAIDEDQQL